MNKEYEEDFQPDPYYAVISVKQKGERIYDSHLWSSKKEVEEFCNSHPELDPVFHRGWDIEERLYVDKWNKASELCKELVRKANMKELSLTEVDNEIKKLPDEL